MREFHLEFSSVSKTVSAGDEKWGRRRAQFENVSFKCCGQKEDAMPAPPSTFKRWWKESKLREAKEAGHSRDTAKPQANNLVKSSLKLKSVGTATAVDSNCHLTQKPLSATSGSANKSVKDP